MSKFDRQIEKNALRKQYEKLTEEWNHAKRNGQKINGHLLGKKPSFGQFKKRMEAHLKLQQLNQKLELEKKIQEEKKMDLEWKDD